MNLPVVSDILLHDNQLRRETVLNILSDMSSAGASYADIYFQSSCREVWVLDKSDVKSVQHGFDRGVGIRAVRGERTGFSYSNCIAARTLRECSTRATRMISDGRGGRTGMPRESDRRTIYQQTDPISSFPNEEKVELLHRIDRIARASSRYVREVTARLSGSCDHILVVANDGTFAADVRPLVQLSVNIQAEKDGRRECGFSGGGGRLSYDFLVQKIGGEVRIDNIVCEAVRIALTNLSAVAAPAGSMPVVLGPGWPGILLHEAVGHGLEGDFNFKGSSVFKDKIGEKVAFELCTVVDDGTLEDRRGSISIDDEGVPGRMNVLIENGILKGYMQDKLSGHLMGMESTGNGRRESYSHLPMPRMTNTYMLAGDLTPEDIVASVDHGIYATNFSGGQVDITSGKFVFSTLEAFLIEHGKITHPVRGVTLIGSGVEVMRQISMIGDDLKLDGGLGTCVKDGQSIPVGVGQPTVKIDKITVGGTA